MTTPVGNAPDGAYVVGTVGGSQDWDDPSIRAHIRGKALPGYQSAQANWASRLFGAIAAVMSGFANIAELVSMVVGAFTGGRFFNLGGLSTYETEQRTNQIELSNRVEQLITGGTRTRYMIDTTWTNPGPGKLVGVAVLNAGQSGSGLNGGVGAKYIYQEWKSEQLPATVNIDVATAAGGVSRFGSYLVGSWSGGGIMTPEGIMETAGNAGNGGLGANYVDGVPVSGTAGTGNALAAGGTYGAGSTAGGQGTNAPWTGVSTAGGGGGGGGGFQQGLVGNADLRGGPGGWPGGGGGGGGFWRATVGGQTSRHAAGAGATGAVFVTVRG